MLTMDTTQTLQLEQVKQFVAKLEGGDQSGHGLDHIRRVTRTISKLVVLEHADEFTALLAGWLHDVIDDKLTNDPQRRRLEVRDFLDEIEVPVQVIDLVMIIIMNMSFSKSLAGQNVVELPLEGQIVQDADRLDAIGALGIARAFYYSGHVGEEMYDPQKKPRLNMTKEQYRQEPGTTINHFYEKLFLITEQLNTKSAQVIGAKRQKVMQDFVAEFKSEWFD